MTRLQVLMELQQKISESQFVCRWLYVLTFNEDGDLIQRLILLRDLVIDLRYVHGEVCGIISSIPIHMRYK